MRGRIVEQPQKDCQVAKRQFACEAVVDAKRQQMQMHIFLHPLAFATTMLNRLDQTVGELITKALPHAAFLFYLSCSTTGLFLFWPKQTPKPRIRFQPSARGESHAVTDLPERSRDCSGCAFSPSGDAWRSMLSDRLQRRACSRCFTLFWRDNMNKSGSFSQILISLSCGVWKPCLATLTISIFSSTGSRRVLGSQMDGGSTVSCDLNSSIPSSRCCRFFALYATCVKI